LDIDSEIIEQIHRFDYLGCCISCCKENDVNIKLSKFQRMCGTVRRKFKAKELKRTQLKFYKIMAGPTLVYNYEDWKIN
jgi:hypothetical protein